MNAVPLHRLEIPCEETVSAAAQDRVGHSDNSTKRRYHIGALSCSACRVGISQQIWSDVRQLRLLIAAKPGSVTNDVDSRRQRIPEVGRTLDVRHHANSRRVSA